MRLTEKILKFVNKFCPEEVPEQKTTIIKKANNSDDEIAIAIACAMSRKLS